MPPHGYQEFIAAEPSHQERLSDLADALLYEATVIEELRQALLKQRAGVAADNPAQIEASVHAMGRTLLTLDEAKRRRAALTSLIAGGDAVPLEHLETILGGTLPKEVEEARQLVKRAALHTAQDVAINQHVLKRALDAGELFLQRLFSMSSEPAPGYQRGERSGEAPAQSGLLLNRMA